MNPEQPSTTPWMPQVPIPIDPLPFQSYPCFSLPYNPDSQRIYNLEEEIKVLKKEIQKLKNQLSLPS